MSLSLKHSASVGDLSTQQILHLLDRGIAMLVFVLTKRRVTSLFEALHKSGQEAPGFVAAMMQASTGTAVSMDAAAWQMMCSNPTASIRAITASSASKGERIHHLVRRLYLSAGINFFAIRSRYEGLVKALALHFDAKHSPHTMLGNNITFLNAGEGARFHPTQVALDLLSIVSWYLFGEAIMADSGYRMSHPNFLAAIQQFLQLSREDRLARIAAVLEGKTVCFSPDCAKSRVVFDWRSAGPKLGMKFLFATPDNPEFRFDSRYLQGIDHHNVDALVPDQPFDVLYKLRWRVEHQPPHVRQLIATLNPSFQIDWRFAEHLRTRKKSAFFLDALPIDKALPSMTSDVEDHPNCLCWLEAFMALAMRMAYIEAGYKCWENEEVVAENCWQLPPSQSAGLIQTRSMTFTEYEGYLRDHPIKTATHVNRLLNGCNLDHLRPVGLSDLVKKLLRRLGFSGPIIAAEDVVPDSNQDGLHKDVMWFPDARLHEWRPEILDVIHMLSEGGMTYNFIDGTSRMVRKFRVDTSKESKVVGILRCPRGMNPESTPDHPEPECIDGHEEEVPNTSVFTLYGPDDCRRARCFYCESIHTAEEMRTHMAALQ
ncbi:MAG: hypothetical protein WCX71_03005 [Candidatus Buchananbacteria bacterium]